MALKGFKAPKVKKSPKLFTSKRPTESATAGRSVTPVQSLNVVEDKLRREFDLAGQIGATLGVQLQPVIIAGDLRDMGHATNKGRGFAVTGPVGTGFAANGHFSFLFNADVLIEGFFFTASAPDDVSLYVTAPTEAIPIAANVASGAWRDRKTVAADVPPAFMSAAAGALTGTAISNGNRLWVYRSGAGGAGGVVPMQIMVPSGGALTFRAGAAGIAIADFGLWGRIWP